jgi:hypothetical protein
MYHTSLFIMLVVLVGCGQSAPTKVKPNTVQAPAPVSPTPDSIDALLARLSSSHGLWQNGPFPRLDVPETASAEQVVRSVFEKISFDRGRVTAHRVLLVREVRIDSDSYTAVLVDTNLGKKIVLFGRGTTLRWSRVYDAPTA